MWLQIHLLLLRIPAVRGLHRRDRVVLHGQILVLGGGALVLGARLHSVSVVLTDSHLLNILGRAAWILNVHYEATGRELLVRLVGQLVDELRSIFINLAKISV